MAPSPRSPSPFVPGAWPASPSPVSRLRNQNGDPGEPHYLRSRQHTPDSHYRKATARLVRHSCCNPRLILATPSTTDNTPTSFTSDDLGLQYSPANTSFSSAYTSTTPNFPLSPETTESSQENEFDFDLRVPYSAGLQCQSPEQGAREDLLGVLDEDQTFLSLPEIPDLSSLSSLREELQISRETFNTLNYDPQPQSYLDEIFLEAHPVSSQQESLETISSSSIRFRQTEGLPASNDLAFDVEPLRLPQPDGRNSWTLFLSPGSICSDAPSFPRPTRTSIGLTMSESECRTANSTAAHARRSWAAGGSFWAGSHPPTEDSSTRRYASDVLDHAFNAEPDFAVGVAGGERTGALAQSNPRSVFTLGVSPRPAYKEKASDNFLRRRAIFLHAVKQVQKKAYEVFARLKNQDIETRKHQNERKKLSVCSRHNPQASSLQDAAYAAPDGPTTHFRRNKGTSLRLQPLQSPATCDIHPQQHDTGMECPCGIKAHPCVTVSSVSNEARNNRLPPTQLQYDLMLTPLQQVGGEGRQTLHRETFEAKNEQRRSFISRIRFQRERRR